MSVAIKLSRVGAKNSPIFRVVVNPTRSKRDGKTLDILGLYDPRHKKVEINKEKFDLWVKKGALITKGVKKILEVKKSK